MNFQKKSDLQLYQLNKRISFETWKQECKNDPNNVFDYINKSCKTQDHLVIKRKRDWRIVENAKTHCPIVMWDDNSINPYWCHSKRLKPNNHYVSTKLPNLPLDIIHFILEYLTPQEYLKCRLLSTKLRKKIENNFRWKYIMENVKGCFSSVIFSKEVQVNIWSHCKPWKQFVNYTLNMFSEKIDITKLRSFFLNNEILWAIGNYASYYTYTKKSRTRYRKIKGIQDIYWRYINIFKKIQSLSVNEFNKCKFDIDDCASQ